MFLNWLGITRNAFDYLVDEHRNPKFWKRKDDWSWEYLPYMNEPESIDSFKLRKPFTPFVQTPEQTSQDARDKFILIGKGK
jgi:hypothetical protein